MNELSKHDLLYLLEKIRAHCRGEYSVYHTGGEDDPEYPLLKRLEDDGLIKLYGKEDGHMMWRLV